MPLSKRASAASCGSPTLDRRRMFATVPRPPERVGVAKSRPRQLERPQATIGYDQYRSLWASDASRRLFYAGLWKAERQRSLKTQQRALRRDLIFSPAPACSQVGPVRWDEASTIPVTPRPHSCGRASDTLSSSSKRSLPLTRQTSLHGEFDPGSGRTLAARLTHASRARTTPSGMGTAANG
jgi:hypothetical protein